ASVCAREIIKRAQPPPMLGPRNSSQNSNFQFTEFFVKSTIHHPGRRALFLRSNNPCKDGPGWFRPGSRQLNTQDGPCLKCPVETEADSRGRNIPNPRPAGTRRAIFDENALDFILRAVARSASVPTRGRILLLLCQRLDEIEAGSRPLIRVGSNCPTNRPVGLGAQRRDQLLRRNEIVMDLFLPNTNIAAS